MTGPWQEAAALPALTLAYIGDTVYETAIRRYLVERGLRKVDQLHRAAVNCVRADFQAAFYHHLLPRLREEETAVLKRARNAHSQKPRHADVQAYHKATAVEALIGAIYLANDQKRLQQIFDLLFAFIEKGDEPCMSN